jgi:hypothetical protein
MKEFLGKERKRGLKTGMPLEMVHWAIATVVKVV